MGRSTVLVMGMGMGIGMVATVTGHSSLLYPPSRNSIDKDLPGWKGGSMGDGKFGPDDWGCNCVNATTGGQVPCDVGQSCFWFSNGCSIGCKTCDGGTSTTGGANPNTRDRCNCGAKATLNDPKYRTFFRDVPAGSAADIYKHNPWRAPGTAPVFDACGMAGGYLQQEAGEAKYTPTTNAAQGKLGSSLPPAPSGVVWKSGATVDTLVSIRANHGGGYSFRLCPASSNLTEACFKSMPLRFVEGNQRLRYANGTELHINGTYVDVGTSPTNSSWAMNPLPYSNAGSPPAFPPPCHERTKSDQGVCQPTNSGPAQGYDECDNSYCSTSESYSFVGNTSFEMCAAECRQRNCTCFDYSPTSQGSFPYEHCRIANTTAFSSIVHSGDNYSAYVLPAKIPTPEPAGQVTDGYCSGQFPFNVIIVDTIEIPDNVPAGDYVLGFRWDCEKSAQVWAACSDITIE